MPKGANFEKPPMGKPPFSVGENTLETADLSSGMYILEIDINGKKVRTLLIRNEKVGVWRSSNA
jgi:hypothetical protein